MFCSTLAFYTCLPWLSIGFLINWQFLCVCHGWYGFRFEFLDRKKACGFFFFFVVVVIF